MSLKYLLDTHVWVWLFNNPEKLSQNVKELLLHPDKYEALLLSAISPWEFCKLIEKGRYRLSISVERWLDEALDFPKLQLIPLTPKISYSSTILPQPFHSDPGDQIIVATAREEKAALLTLDQKLQNYPHVKTYW